MIIVVSPSDIEMYEIAKEQSYNFPATYGDTYAWGDLMPQLQPTENLFITGHCIADTDGAPLIGDETAIDPYEMTGHELALNIQPLFPDLYEGGVYVSACYSADPGPGGFALIEQFKAALNGSVGNFDVFGQSGEVDYSIPPPNDPVWEPAIIDA